MFYYAYVDENGVLCVGEVDESSQNPRCISHMARNYPSVIYFEVEEV